MHDGNEVTTLKRTQTLLWVVVVVVAGIIVWRVGFYTPSSYLSGVEPNAKGTESQRKVVGPNQPTNNKAPMDSNAPAAQDANAPSDANKPPEPNGPAGPAQDRQPGATEKPESHEPGPEEPNAADKAKPSDPNASGEQLEAINLKEVEMKNVIDKIATWTGKTVIPDDEAMKQKITIYAPEKLPRPKALAKIYSALRMKGFIAEEVDDTIFLKPIKEAKLGVVPTVSADEPLAMFENKDQIVRKFFKLQHYDPTKMVDIVKPLIGDYGHVGADEATGQLLVIDTVANLMSVANVVAQFDVPDTGKSVDEIFEIQYGDPAEIIQLIRLLMGETPSGSGQSGSSRSRSSRSPSPSGPSVTATGEELPALIPVPKRKWIIARGSAESIEVVREWVKKLDKEDPVRSEYETVSLRYANAREVATRIDDALANMPGAEGLRPSIMVRPLEQSRQVMIIGRADLREMVKGLIAEIDMPTGTFETKVFPLKHADPDQIKANVESLYTEGPPTSGSSSAYFYYYYYGPGRNSGGADTVKVISFPTMSQVTVIASPENMRKIEKQIEEWDIPLDAESVKPRIIELHNSDPVKMVEVLSDLFTEKTSSFSFWDYYYGTSEDKKKIVGPLYGQMTFKEVPGTKKIIVVSKIPQAYTVIEQLVYDLDRQEMAETPTVVQLKYADSEDLAERLNAMFNVEGTAARIRRSNRGLSAYSMNQSDSSNQGQSNNSNNNNNNNDNSAEYTPPWSAGGARRTTDEEPISNVIGRVRFIPDPRSKSLLVLAPPEFQKEIAGTIRDLDVPGKQVLLKAIVVEVDHGSMTSLGVQLATDPAAFGAVGENAITALGQLTNLATRGSAVAVNPETNILGATGTGTIVGGTTAVYSLIDFLIKTTNAKILNQQTLWTEDNEEAMFFKGQVVAFTGGTVLTGAGASQQGVEYRDVGMVVQVRPSITPERHVDMEIRLRLSQLTSELVNNQPLQDKLETSTNMIVQDGETIMLGGMLFQTEKKVKRKLPLFGDLPLVGGLFQHNSEQEANNELIVFVTPFVIDEVGATSEKAGEQIDESRDKLEGVQQRMEEMSEKLDKEIKKQ
jgi:general secretion pathway protein D